MITLGRSIRWQNDYAQEVSFSKQTGFDFMQIWFQKGILSVDTLPEPKEQYIKEQGFPIILHAVFDLNDFAQYGDQLIELCQFFGHEEVIVHPVCNEQPITQDTIHILSAHVGTFSQKLKQYGVRFYLENNSIIDGFHVQACDLAIVHGENPDVELLLDLAHIHSYAHLQGILAVKTPSCLHVADKHFSAPHEHLPLGEGELDFELLFRSYLQHFDGRIILEITYEDDKIIRSKEIIEKALASHQHAM